MSNNFGSIYYNGKTEVEIIRQIIEKSIDDDDFAKIIEDYESSVGYDDLMNKLGDHFNLI